jgi:ABC-2 type transport system permease protein
MSRLRALVSMDLKNHFPLALLWRQIRYDTRRVRPLLIAILVTAALVPLVFAFVHFITWLYGSLHMIGQESALIAFGVIAGQLTIFVLGLFYIIAAFYFASDLHILIPLPLRPNQVVLSKLIVVIVTEYLLIMPIVLPVLLGYGILARAPLSYWALLPPVYLLLPIIPLSLSALLAIGLMRVVNLSRRKDTLIVVGSLLLIVLQLFINLRIRGAGNDTAGVLRIFTEHDGLVRTIGRGFPPSIWASRSLTAGFSPEGLSQLLLLAGASALAFVGIVALSEKLFYQGAIGLNEIAARRRTLSRGDMEKAISSGRHPVRALFQRELRLMNRTPIFLLNGVLVVVIVPVIVLIAASSSRGGGSLLALIRSLGSRPSATEILAIAAFLLVCGCLNGTASSALSREGRHFWISKVIPVPWRQQIAAKLLHSYLIALLGIVVALGVAAIALRLPARSLAPAAVLALAGSALLNIVGLRIDVARPLLKWTNPQVAIKQNLNVILAMILDLSFMATCGFLAHFLLSAGLSDTLVLLLILGVALGGACIAWRELIAYAGRKCPRIDA